MDEDLSGRVKRYEDRLVSVAVDAEELAWLREAVAGRPGPTVGEYPGELRFQYSNAMLADVEIKHRLLLLLALAQSKV